MENLKFRYLEAFAIVIVVLSHTGGISLLSDWFPYYSYHMPLFIFISGYFYSEKGGTISFIKHKVKTLLVPLYAFALAYGVVETLLRNSGLVSWGVPLTVEGFIFSPSATSMFMGSSWFLMCLFLTQILYFAFRKLMNLIVKNEYALTTVTFILGLIGTSIAMIPFFLEHNPQFRLPVMVLFGLPFFSLGLLYKLKLEKHDKPRLLSFAVIFVAQAFLLTSGVNMVFVMGGAGFPDAVMPFLSSLTGIWLWLQVASLASRLGENKLITYIGSNTKMIFMNQAATIVAVNLAYLCIGCGDLALFKSQGQYLITPVAGVYQLFLVYSVAGIALPLLVNKAVSLVRGMRS